MQIRLDHSQLLQWADLLDEIWAATPAVTALAVNRYGEDFANGLAEDIADDYDLDANQVRAAMIIYQADAANPAWEVDLSQVLAMTQEDWQGRPWPTRAGEGYEARPLLFNIIGYADCCDLCAQIASEGPYTPEQIANFKAEWANFIPAPPARGRVRTNLLHPNCYCATKPWRDYRRPVAATYGKHTVHAQPRNFGHYMAEEMKSGFRLIVSKYNK